MRLVNHYRLARLARLAVREVREVRRTQAMLAGLGLLAVLVAPAEAATGDCGQPLSNGDAPTASDALFTLRAAIGIATCDLEVCDVDGNCSLSASDALRILGKAVGQPVELLCPLDCTAMTPTTTSSTSTTLPAATWADVFELFASSGCGLSGCHGSAFAQAGLAGLHDIDLGYAAIVGITSTQLPSLDRVEAFEPELSYLMHKLQNSQLSVGGTGNRMPSVGLPFDEATLATVRSWIRAGAQR